MSNFVSFKCHIMLHILQVERVWQFHFFSLSLDVRCPVYCDWWWKMKYQFSTAYVFSRIHLNARCSLALTRALPRSAVSTGLSLVHYPADQEWLHFSGPLQPDVFLEFSSLSAAEFSVFCARVPFLRWPEKRCCRLDLRPGSSSWLGTPWTSKRIVRRYPASGLWE